MPESTIRSIVARAEGIPLYAVETIRMLVADGRLVERAGGGYEPAGELGDLEVPNTLHALIAARLDGLDPADRALVQDAAVLGQSFRLDAVAAVVGADPAEMGQRLERLVRQDLLHREVDPRSPERGQFAFVQALIREVAYGTLSLRDRRARHLAAARHFEALGDEELGGALAAHYVAAFRASTEGPEADALAGQARISLRAAADRATALGAPGQAVTFLEQAIELTADARDRAALHEQAGRAALDSARADVALAHFEAATATWVAVGDRSSQARTVAWEGQALSMARLRDEGLARLAAAWEQLRDLGADDPNLVLLARGLAGMSMLNGDYERANALADQALASAERLGLADMAAEALVVMGTTAFYRGRQWQARALLTGARLLAEEAGLADTALRIMITLPSFVALDDPRASLTLQQEAIELARRLGRRGSELAILFNASEDARRTGEWEWAVRELESSLQLDVDEASALGTRGQLAFFDIYRGQSSTGQIEELAAALSALEDRDMHSAVDDIGGSDAHAQGRWADAASAWMRIADISDLNAPYALPRAGRVAILARDSALAQVALDRLAALGTRGRAVDADRATIRAGLAALAGDPDAARAGYRAALVAYRDLGLTWDEALVAQEAASMLGAGDPEIAGWLETARGTFIRLGAAPMLALLDQAVAGAGAAPRGRASTAEIEPVAPVEAAGA
jgi:tetratricopeptide (TPR) repeat protein